MVMESNKKPRESLDKPNVSLRYSYEGGQSIGYSSSLYRTVVINSLMPLMESLTTLLILNQHFIA